VPFEGYGCWWADVIVTIQVIESYVLPGQAIVIVFTVIQCSSDRQVRRRDQPRQASTSFLDLLLVSLEYGRPSSVRSHLLEKKKSSHQKLWLNKLANSHDVQGQFSSAIAQTNPSRRPEVLHKASNFFSQHHPLAPTVVITHSRQVCIKLNLCLVPLQ
jgi:hypothetical protein